MSILEKLGKKVDIVRPPPVMSTLSDKEYGYIDDRVYRMDPSIPSHRINLTGGVLIPRNHSFMGVHVAIPSQFAESLANFLALPRHLRPEAPAARVQWALDRLIREKYNMGEYVLLDMANEDEGRLHRLTGSREFDTGKIFLTEKNWRLLPKVFKKWEPKNTQIDASAAGFRLTFFDDKNRPLIRVIVDDASGTNPQTHQPAKINPKSKSVSWALTDS
ncbi:hypothetical protein E8E14_013140 [Neopestalotiopsis sp. 37M]|nr:hypothetical protein E8E14_013140 [Neopestalotiopsis sp. 37M]